MNSDSENIAVLEREIAQHEELSRQLFLDITEAREQQAQVCYSQTWQGRYFNFLGYIVAAYCVWKIVTVRSRSIAALRCRRRRRRPPSRTDSVHAPYARAQSTINIVFDRVGKIDPVTRSFEILVNWLGLSFDVPFWSQQVSFVLVGIIVLTSIRGLLIQLTKVVWRARAPSAQLDRTASAQRRAQANFTMQTFYAIASSASSNLIVLFLAHIMGMYFVSSVLLMRMSVPFHYRYMARPADRGRSGGVQLCAGTC